MAAPVPGGPGPDEQCLLLVHVRRVVGQVRYRICPGCARGVISTLAIDGRFLSTGLDTRALSHLRSRYPDVTWFSTVRRRAGRELFRRMRVTRPSGGRPCAHLGAAGQE
ncbi:hypothetical protein IAG43_01165 [Streptomyces genisteinicus]|uniref:Uncharacterized protein n=1 Tax=Streptomyces genisteinicus TaxID=2768068 RepID=A0A7H0I323_9ACTN|nr:hypothetical protein IAG43_01165 [Streptomyces genisteinicus]